MTDTPTPIVDMAAIRGAVARAWCSPCNSHKEMDADLAELAALEVAALLGIKPQPTKPREFWVMLPRQGTFTGPIVQSQKPSDHCGYHAPIHVREVLE